LADFDLTGGTIGFYLKLNHNYSVVEACSTPSIWIRLFGIRWP
jgi:hypothetical protein